MVGGRPDTRRSVWTARARARDCVDTGQLFNLGEVAVSSIRKRVWLRAREICPTLPSVDMRACLLLAAAELHFPLPDTDPGLLALDAASAKMATYEEAMAAFLYTAETGYE